ncbi:MAG: hypothetical protein Fur0018_11450 [Anaerolineales bacterium]
MCANPPDVVHQHFHSILTLLQDAHPIPACLPEVAELIQALRLWPLRWGYWSAWEEQIRHALSHDTGLDKRQRAMFLTHLGQVYVSTGRGAMAESVWKQADTLAMEMEDMELLSDVVYQRVSYLLNMQQQEQAWEIFKASQMVIDRHLAVLPQSAQLHTLARLALTNAILKRRAGCVDDILTEISVMVERMKQQPMPDTALLAELYAMRATLEWDEERYPLSIASLQQALTCFQELQDRFAQIEIYGDRGLVYWSMFALDEAEVHLRQAVRDAEQLNAHYRRVVDIGNLGLVHLVRGDLSLAERYLQRQYWLARRSNNQREADRACGNLGIVRYFQGKYDLALPVLAQIYMKSRAKNFLVAWAIDALYLGLCYLATHNAGQGISLLQEAMDVSARLHSEVLSGLCLRAQALFYPPDDAYFFLSRALKIAKARQRPFDEAACLLLMARLMPQAEAAHQCWQDGVDILKRMNATVWLDGHSLENPPVLPFVR